MAKFILNRPDDFLTLSKKKIIGITLKWLVILMGGAILLRVICMAIYMAFGIDPMEATQFGGDPTNYMGNASWKTFFKLLITGPLLEELMFRLGLSLKRSAVALWVAGLPVVYAYYLQIVQHGTYCSSWPLPAQSCTGWFTVSPKTNNGRPGEIGPSFRLCGFLQ